MATYAYDDFEVRFTPAGDDGYDMVAEAPDGRLHRTRFRVPLSTEQLEAAVVQIAAARRRLARAGSTREIAPIVGEPEAIDGAIDEAELDAEQVGAALADALFADGVGAAYDAAREASSVAQRGLRLTLSLGDAPALLSLPWEFLYRRPRFIASQRHLPLVRRLDTGSLTAPPAITDTVKILAVVSSPSDLSQLDVDAERARVQRAVEKMVLAGRVQLDWLEPATPGRLRKALRDDSYHILHYVGHSSFTSAGESAIFLEDEHGRAVAVDDTVLANLLSDQSTLRLVVLNSCEGARTTLHDPYAGVATTLIHLGVPAVVAMQFEISDEAAILFADELYTNLIGRQDPIDAAVAEARKAIYVEIDRVEWATPVLFVRDPEVQLFDFKLPVAPLPPPPPPAPLRDDEEPDADATDDAAPPAAPDRSPRRSRRGWRVGIGAGAVALIGAVVGTLLVLRDDGTGAATTTTAAAASTTPDTAAGPTTIARAVSAPRGRTGFLAAQVREESGDTHLYPLDLSTGRIGVITDRPEATDTEPDWDTATNRLAFTRSRPRDGEGTGLFYVVPGDFGADAGKQVAPLVPWTPGTFDHVPAWTADGALLFMRTDGCRPGTFCGERLHRATFDAAPDARGFLDALTVRGDAEPVGDARFEAVTAMAAHPSDGGRAVVADGSGLWLVDGGSRQLFAPEVLPRAVTFTADGSQIVAVGDGPQGQVFGVWDADGGLVQAAPIVGDSGATRFTSLTADPDADTLLALAVSPLDDAAVVMARLRITDTGLVGIDDVVDLAGLSDLGAVQAIAL